MSPQPAAHASRCSADGRLGRAHERMATAPARPAGHVIVQMPKSRSKATVRPSARMVGNSTRPSVKRVS